MRDAGGGGGFEGLVVLGDGGLVGDRAGCGLRGGDLLGLECRVPSIRARENTASWSGRGRRVMRLTPYQKRSPRAFPRARPETVVKRYCMQLQEQMCGKNPKIFY